MYSVDRAASHPKATSPSATAAGPSSSSDSASSGTGTTTADHTVSASPPRAPEARETTFPTPHDNAPSRHSARASTGTWPPRPRATTTSPTDPTSTPSAWAAVGRSRSTPAAMTTVKITCAWSTSAASPGGMPASIATYRKPNWPSDMNAPTAASVRHGRSGRGSRNTAGTSTTTKRIATKSRGGTPSMPQSMTTKLKPQIVATTAARSESRRFTPPA